MNICMKIIILESSSPFTLLLYMKLLINEIIIFQFFFWFDNEKTLLIFFPNLTPLTAFLEEMQLTMPFYNEVYANM